MGTTIINGFVPLLLFEHLGISDHFPLYRQVIVLFPSIWNVAFSQVNSRVDIALCEVVVVI